MKRLLLIATVTMLSPGVGAVADGAELPSYQVMGFPITSLQFSVLRSALTSKHPTRRLRWQGCQPLPIIR